MNEQNPRQGIERQSTLFDAPAAAPFTDEEIAELSLAKVRHITFRDGETLIEAGQRVRSCYLLLEGWVGRVYNGANGRQQIVNIYLPGDMCLIRQGFERQAVMDAMAYTDGQVLELDTDDIVEAARRVPSLQDKLNWHTVRSMNIISHHVVSLSLRDSARRILYQLLELWNRLILVRAAGRDGFLLPLTQAELGQLCGLSVVAVNRAMRRLKEDGLIATAGRHITFPDVPRAMAMAEFDPGYLSGFENLMAAE